jgi:iron complex transport system substrate-binding protein
MTTPQKAKDTKAPQILQRLWSSIKPNSDLSWSWAIGAIGLTFMMVGCQYRAQDQPTGSSTRQVIDRLGRKIEVRFIPEETPKPISPTEGAPSRQPLRIMALSAALTEMLFAVVPDSEIVGVSHACNYPPDKVANKPKVNTYPVDFERIIMLKPELVLAEEGIVSFETAAQLERLKIPCYFFKYDRLADIWAAMDTIGVLTGHKRRARLVSDSLRRVQQTFEITLNGEGSTPRVLSLVSDKPIYAWGRETMMTDQLRLAGGANAITERFAKAYPELTREYVLKLNPDVIFGGDMRSLDSSFFNFYPELRSIKAYRNHQCYKLDADISTRPGPRALQSVERMKALLHPEASK